MLTENPVFSDLCRAFPLAQYAGWPAPDELSRWLNPDYGYRFTDSADLAADGRYYEAYIYETRQIPTRLQNWHDLFGALIWCLFPATKQLLNRLHQHEIAQHGLKQRSILRNKLTLLDECGVILACEPGMAEHIGSLQQHCWHQVFWQNRHIWWQTVRPVIFGHAIYEMATRPFLGLTAKCWFVEVPAGFCQWPVTDAYTFLDEKLSKQIADGSALLDNQQLTPLPLLGVPGWYNDNQHADFYNNTDYFRPLRLKTGPLNDRN
ncbi:DUF3025 domain-containing protein [Chromatiaceae bacterium AAb-1]|nr:DUF3025 domain-containing protein [Chromatiaceae bacterium AAb-1]